MDCQRIATAAKTTRSLYSDGLILIPVSFLSFFEALKTFLLASVEYDHPVKQGILTTIRSYGE